MTFNHQGTLVLDANPEGSFVKFGQVGWVVVIEESCLRILSDLATHQKLNIHLGIGGDLFTQRQS